MEIKSFNDGALTNVEVLELIRERRRSRAEHGETKVSADTQHREHIEQKMQKYIESTPGGKVPFEKLQRCLARIKQTNAGLSENEMIQIANLLPETDVELYLIVDNVAERLSEDQQAVIKAIIAEECGREAK